MINEFTLTSGLTDIRFHTGGPKITWSGTHEGAQINDLKLDGQPIQEFVAEPIQQADLLRLVQDDVLGKSFSFQVGKYVMTNDEWTPQKKYIWARHAASKEGFKRPDLNQRCEQVAEELGTS